MGTEAILCKWECTYLKSKKRTKENLVISLARAERYESECLDPIPGESDFLYTDLARSWK